MPAVDTLERSQARDEHRIFQVKTPLDEKLVFRRMSGVDQLGRMFEYEIEMLSENLDLDLSALLGEKLTVMMEIFKGEEKTERYYSGHVTRISQVGMLGRYAVYRGTLRPWLWFLTRGAKCRIFENTTVPDIVKKIFREHGFSEFEDFLTTSHQHWEYRVQYRESDFDFVSRLMEEEGIYYFFKQEATQHTLVLADSVSAHVSIGSIPYFPADEHGRRERDHVSDWLIAKEVQPGAYAIRDFNFMKPSTDLELTSNAPNQRSHAHADLKIEDFTTELYVEGKEPKDRTTPANLARIRIEELQSQHEEVQGAGDLFEIHAGVLFKLKDFPRADQNREYAVTSSRFELVENEYETGISEDAISPYSCSFTAIDRIDQFRPPRITPKSVVKGPHTAIVVGGGKDSGGGGGNDEVWTDKYGRVRVHFHWERENSSSCWARVSQAWAGKNWGAMAIPRVGQEVIVEFLEGDPDRPIITGRVYNAEQVVPYPLPDQATKTTFKSNSSPGGGGFNEWRFEDKAGEEEIFIHAQKDMNSVILNDKTESVGVNRSREVGNNESVIVGNERQHDVGGNEFLTVGKDQDVSVGKNHILVVGDNQTVEVGKNILIKAGTQLKLECGAASLTLKKDGTIQISGVKVTLNGTGTATLSSGGKTKVQGSIVQVSGTGAVSVQGSVVKIN